MAQPRVGGLPAPGLVGLLLDLAGHGARMEVARGGRDEAATREERESVGGRTRREAAGRRPSTLSRSDPLSLSGVRVSGRGLENPLPLCRASHRRRKGARPPLLSIFPFLFFVLFLAWFNNSFN